jgi:N-formylmaleamate deformylase
MLDAKPSTYLYGAHVRANQIRQHYLRYGGAGKPLIIIPGITSPAMTWGFVGDRFGQTFDTYVLDVRGRGLSESGQDLEYGLDACAQDVAEFAAALKLARYSVVGHSNGGRIAARLGRRFGEAIDRVVLADPPVSGPGRKAYVRTAEYYLDINRKAKAGLVDADVLRQTHPSWADEHLRIRAEWLHTCDETAIRESVRGFLADDIHQDIAGMPMPTMLMVAGKAGVITDDDVAEIRQLQPAIAVAHVERSGHQIPFEDPETFFRVAGDFLARS